MPGILKFRSMLFLTFKKGDQQKNCARYFLIRKHSFLIFENETNKKIVPGILRFVSIRFFIFKKGDKQKLCPGFFRIYKHAFFNV